MGAKTWLGFGIVWAGYALGFWGYCLVKNYNLSFRQVVAPVNYYGAGGETWPPATYSGTGVFPSGNPSDSGAFGKIGQAFGAAAKAGESLAGQ